MEGSETRSAILLNIWYFHNAVLSRKFLFPKGMLEKMNKKLVSLDLKPYCRYKYIEITYSTKSKGRKYESKLIIILN
jgi:hypothetical protein